MTVGMHFDSSDDFHNYYIISCIVNDDRILLICWIQFILIFWHPYIINLFKFIHFLTNSIILSSLISIQFLIFNDTKYLEYFASEKILWLVSWYKLSIFKFSKNKQFSLTAIILSSVMVSFLYHLQSVSLYLLYMCVMML